MIYLGVNRKIPLDHHTIFFAKDYRSNLHDISTRKVLSDDISFYIQNASATDPSLAPEGKSTLYILVPAPNQSGSVDWTAEKESFKNHVLDLVVERTGVEKYATPNRCGAGDHAFELGRGRAHLSGRYL